MMSYILSLGSNKGNRFLNLEMAIKLLRQSGNPFRTSSVYQSSAYGIRQQAEFLNLICLFETSLRPNRLLRKLKSIELELGRERTYKWGPRIIDIDIIDWNGETLSTEILTIPHPDYKNRDFVLTPLHEIEPTFITRCGTTLSALIEQQTFKNISGMVNEK